MTLIITSILGFILAYGWEYFCTHIIKRTALIILGYRLHHSLYGLLFIVLGLYVQNIILIGLGIGILIQHTVTDGFRFLSKK
jgi:hypothetical protein